MLNEGVGYTLWKENAVANKGKGSKLYHQITSFVEFLSKLPSCTVMLGGEGCYGDEFGVMIRDLRLLFDATNIFGYTGSSVLKKLAKKTLKDWHCYDTTMNKRRVLTMMMAWAEFFNVIKNVDLPRANIFHNKEMEITRQFQEFHFPLEYLQEDLQMMQDIALGKCIEAENKLNLLKWEKVNAGIALNRKIALP